MTLLIATGNRGKLAEFRTLFGAATNTPFAELVSLADLGIEPGPETAGTFLENALQKGRHAAAASNLPCLADDSGLVVPALGGAPGIRSARYAADAGGERSDSANNTRLLDELR